MKRILLSTLLSSLLLIGLLAPSASAALRPVWRRSVGTTLRSVAVAPDGFLYATGDKPRAATRTAVLVKFSPRGRRLWSRTWLPAKWASTHGISVDVAPDGTIVLLGTVWGTCEGGGWFLRRYAAGGRLLSRYTTPGWQCGLAETVYDVAAGSNLIAVAGMDHGCCGDPTQDGWVRGFDREGRPIWETDFEPPATPHDWFDRATGVAIGGLGNVFVSGWAASERVRPGDGSPATRGTILIGKLTSGGGMLWTRRVRGVGMPGDETTAAVSVRSDRMMVSAPVMGLGAAWFRGGRASTGWLGRFTTGGELVWQRTWDATRPRAAEPEQVAVDASLVTWVVGSRRDLSDKGIDLFVRRYSPSGRLLSNVSMDGAARYLFGTGVAPAGRDGFVTGYVGDRYANGEAGRLWRLALT
jgi:hypothetical protein